jgi:spore germination protein YaaH
MQIGFRAFLMAVLAWSLTAGVPTPALGGWITYWALDPGLRSARASKGQLKDVFLFALHLDAVGNPVAARPDKAWLQAVAELHGLNATVWLTVVNDRQDKGGRIVLKDTALMHELLSDPVRRRRHIADLVAQCGKFRADGLDIDYENMDLADRELFSLFIAELADALHTKRLSLSVTVQPKLRESRSVGPGAADWAAIGKVADRLQIMLYNLHNTRTKPGPVCTSSWIEQVLAFAATQCDKAKIVPVLKVSGFQWGPKPREVAFRDLAAPRQALTSQPLRDPDGQSPYVVFDVDGKSHTAYYEDALSLKAKLAFLNDLGYPKAVLWSLGPEDPAFWEPEGPAH